ncbi:MAG: hypothetical protein KGL59_02370 [Acidobacteriota bacterium]|nr:hypothetical protein [Acidobacteriota bacterium]
MKFRRFVMPALLAGCVSLAALGGPMPAAAQEVQALNPASNDMQTQGKVGDTAYRWTNGRAWMSLNDDAKVAMVAGLEQGIILSVRENWKAVPKESQQEITKTATRLTVGGFTFDQLVLQIDNFYLMPGDINVPVVDAYMFALTKLKKASDDQLKDLANHLRKLYPPPPMPKNEDKH